MLNTTFVSFWNWATYDTFMIYLVLSTCVCRCVLIFCAERYGFRYLGGCQNPVQAGQKLFILMKGINIYLHFLDCCSVFGTTQHMHPRKLAYPPENWWLEDEISFLKWGLIPNTHGLKRLSSASNIAFFRIFGVYVYKMSLDLDSHNGQSQYPLITNKYIKCILWVVPLPSKSHHQDYYIFSRESL